MKKIKISSFAQLREFAANSISNRRTLILYEVIIERVTRRKKPKPADIKEMWFVDVSTGSGSIKQTLIKVTKNQAQETASLPDNCKIYKAKLNKTWKSTKN